MCGSVFLMKESLEGTQKLIHLDFPDNEFCVLNEYTKTLDLDFPSFRLSFIQTFLHLENNDFLLKIMSFCVIKVKLKESGQKVFQFLYRPIDFSLSSSSKKIRGNLSALKEKQTLWNVVFEYGFG